MLKSLRRLLGVGRNTQSDALRGECGQFKLYSVCVVKCVKYWLKLLDTEEGSLLNSCYYCPSHSTILRCYHNLLSYCNILCSLSLSCTPREASHSP